QRPTSLPFTRSIFIFRRSFISRPTGNRWIVLTPRRCFLPRNKSNMLEDVNLVLLKQSLPNADTVTGYLKRGSWLQ
ncbi:unnamed protein product, partial [Musa banksii]